MTITTKLWLILCAIITWTGAAWFHGYHTRDLSAISEAQALKLKQSESANHAWAERFALQGQLATIDLQLAQAQQAARNARTETIIKREVIYRDRIKNVAVRDCVANSGLLDVYDATLGLSNSAE